MIKNVAGQKWVILAFDPATAIPVTGDAANITGKINLDYAGLVAITDTNPTELESGYYEFDLTQAETNADHISIIPVSATGDIQVIGDPGVVVPKAAGISDLVITSGAVETDTASRTASKADVSALATDADMTAVLVTTGKLDDTLEDDGGTYRFTANALEQAPSGSIGPGGIMWTETVTDSESNPVSGVRVWVTTDIAGNNVVAGTLVTDGDGKVVFMLYPGTRYFWFNADSLDIDQPVTRTVS